MQNYLRRNHIWLIPTRFSSNDNKIQYSASFFYWRAVPEKHVSDWPLVSLLRAFSRTAHPNTLLTQHRVSLMPVAYTPNVWGQSDEQFSKKDTKKYVACSSGVSGLSFSKTNVTNLRVSAPTGMLFNSVMVRRCALLIYNTMTHWYMSWSCRSLKLLLRDCEVDQLLRKIKGQACRQTGGQ